MGRTKKRPALTDQFQRDLLDAAGLFAQRASAGLADVIVEGARRLVDPPIVARAEGSVSGSRRKLPEVVTGDLEWFAFLQYIDEDGKVTERWVRFKDDDPEFSPDSIERDYRTDPKARALIIVRGKVLVNTQKTPPGVTPVIDGYEPPPVQDAVFKTVS